MDHIEKMPENTRHSEDMAFEITPIILSGGTGSRLWPVSRASYPKQFWPLVTGDSLFQDTVRRGMGRGFTHPIIVCNEEHRFLISEHLHEAGVIKSRIILEPAGRNSAPAVAAAALLAAETDPQSILWVMASDTAIQDPDGLRRALSAGYQAARQGHFVTFGITPTQPETGYGYMQMGRDLPGLPHVRAVTRFLEKPKREAAITMLAEGGYLWNAGMFMFTAQTLLEELEKYAPDVLAAVSSALLHRREDLGFTRLGKAEFEACPSISLDYAVAEHSERVAVVVADMGWSDVGSWNSLWELGAKDIDGNVAIGDVLLQDSTNCLVRSDGKLTAVIGLEDAIIVTTDDAVLALHRDQAQDVKRLVDELQALGRNVGIAHNRCYRPWGFYEQLIAGDRFQVKRIVVKPGQKLSLQMHYHRAEHWVVVAGTAMVTRDEEIIMLRENESVYLPLGCTHRLENPGRIPLTLIEVQSGAYLGEDDIVRIEDTYGR